jgi:hypothetical protein
VVEQRRSMAMGGAQSSIVVAIQFELSQTWANLLNLVTVVPRKVRAGCNDQFN